MKEALQEIPLQVLGSKEGETPYRILYAQRDLETGITHVAVVVPEGISITAYNSADIPDEMCQHPERYEWVKITIWNGFQQLILSQTFRRKS
jgi:hypothetical protein